MTLSAWQEIIHCLLASSLIVEVKVKISGQCFFLALKPYCLIFHRIKRTEYFYYTIGIFIGGKYFLK